MQGMNPDPCASYSLADRFTCAKCGVTPNIKKADGRGPISITFECHGETETRVVEKEKLVFQQYVFEPNE